MEEMHFSFVYAQQTVPRCWTGLQDAEVNVFIVVGDGNGD